MKILGIIFKNMKIIKMKINPYKIKNYINKKKVFNLIMVINYFKNNNHNNNLDKTL